MQQLSIIIPAHNEELRIKNTLAAYCIYFEAIKQQQQLDVELVVVLNGCSDNTLSVVQEMQTRYSNIRVLDLSQAGKGLAIKAGFDDALQRNNALIGFVDADMATEPQYFYDLVKKIDGYDGAIASRYMPDSKIFPPRPWIKRWGSWLIYESLITLLFGMRYQDYQCGAKLFKRSVVETITPHITVTQWAFDVEVLYLCKKHGYKIIEVPTTWYDRAGSKLRISSGFKMLGNLFKVRFKHMFE
jgi:glycosyltransferase involved in cell wall biosynthesis